MNTLKAMRRHGIRLAIFAALTTGLSAVVNQLTTPTIARQTASQQQILLDQVLPGIDYDNNLQADCYVVTDKRLGTHMTHRLYLARRAGKPIAAAVESTAPDGYSGAIRLLVGADFAGHVLGVRVLEHHETPGLGDKIEIRRSPWIESFQGQRVINQQDTRWAVKKDQGMFDQFTGATITPRAVVRAVKQTTLYLMQQPLSQLPQCENK